MPAAARRCGVLFLLLAACGDPAPPAPTVELRAGPDTVSTGYAEIQDAVWLGARRWAVVAPLDVTVGVVDLGPGRDTAGWRGDTGDPQPRERLPRRRHACTSATGGSAGSASGAGTAGWCARFRPPPAPAARFPGRPGCRRPLVPRAQAGIRPRRQRQPRLRGRGRRRSGPRGPGHPGLAGAAGSRGGGRRRGATVRAAGPERHRPLGRAARRLGLGGAGLPRTGWTGGLRTASG